MKTLLSLVLMLGACASDLEHEPGPGAAGSFAEAPSCGVEPASEPEGVGSISQPLVTCVGRPANRKLLSLSCPTCPLIWVYSYQTVPSSQMLQAAQNINTVMGWHVVGFDPGAWSTTTNIPTYGVISQRNGNYDLPGDPCSGSSFIAGDWLEHHYGCYRDRIRVVNSTCLSPSQAVTTFMHEYMHALLRTNTDDFNTLNDHDLNHPNSLMGTPSTGSRAFTAPMVTYLNNVRSYVLDGWGSLPCALRGLEC